MRATTTQRVFKSYLGAIDDEEMIIISIDGVLSVA